MNETQKFAHQILTYLIEQRTLDPTVIRNESGTWRVLKTVFGVSPQIFPDTKTLATALVESAEQKFQVRAA